MEVFLYLAIGIAIVIASGIFLYGLYRTAVDFPSLFPLSRRRRLARAANNPYTDQDDRVAYWDFVRRAKNSRNLAVSYEPRRRQDLAHRPSAKIIPFKRPEEH